MALACDFDTERYVSLATFRRDGRVVATPVWFAGRDPYYIFSQCNAGKVKRIRNNDRVRLAVCDYKGNTRGVWFEARARFVDDPVVAAAAYGALTRKYGWQMRLVDLASKLSGRYATRCLLAVTLES